MSTPRDTSGTPEPGAPAPWRPADDNGEQSRVDLSKDSGAGARSGDDTPAEPEAPFDPYRFGLPDHPVPPEYAPPGYVPPTPPGSPVAGGPYAGAPGNPYAGGPYGGGPGRPGAASPYGGPGGWAPPSQTEYGPPPGSRNNGKAVAALVLGILSIVFCFASIFDLALVIPAVVLGALALGDAKRGRGGRGMAMSGLILGLVGALLAITITVWIYPKVRHCLDDYPSGSSQYNQCVRDQF